MPKVRAPFFEGSVLFCAVLVAGVVGSFSRPWRFRAGATTSAIRSALPSQGNAAMRLAQRHAATVLRRPPCRSIQSPVTVGRIRPPASNRTPTAAAINLPSPPPATAFTNDPNQLQAQAEQTALQAQADAEAAQAKREKEYNEKSFGRASSGLLPLSPDQIRDFMHKLEQTQDAAEPPYAGPPERAGAGRNACRFDPGVLATASQSCRRLRDNDQYGRCHGRTLADPRCRCRRQF